MVKAKQTTEKTDLSALKEKAELQADEELRTILLAAGVKESTLEKESDLLQAASSELSQNGRRALIKILTSCHSAGEIKEYIELLQRMDKD